MPLHPAIAAMVQAMQQDPNYRPVHSLTPVQARDGYRALAGAFGPPPEVASLQDRSIPGPAGDIPVRVYAPAGAGPHPLLVFYHGGGWTIGDLDTHDRECRTLCNEAGCLVVAVDYRLAPEHRFPAAVDDAWAALQWVARNATALNGDATRVAVGGDSAGGNLAAVLALRARDEAGPALRAQILVYPAVAGAQATYASYEENAHAPFLPLQLMDYFRSHYLGASDAAGRDPRAAPILATSHRDLPPALIITAQYDPLRDEGRDYARKLESAGVDVRHIEYAGMPHMFFQLSPVVEEARAALRACSDALRRAFAK